MIHLLSVDNLWEMFLYKVEHYQEPSVRWWGCGNMPTREEIKSALGKGNLRNEHGVYWGDRAYHIGRIAYFVKHLAYNDPVRVCKPIDSLALYDGLHRLMAARYRGDTCIGAVEIEC